MLVSQPSSSHILLMLFLRVRLVQPHGQAWKIHNKDLLVRDIVPKYFVQSKYESFTRQLNGWGFKWLHQSGNDFNAYYHECFLRGMPHLTVLLKRVAPNQGKLLPHVEGEPNFYEIEKQFPLPSSLMKPYQPHAHGYHHPYPPAMGNGYHYAGVLPPSEVPAARPYPFYPSAYHAQPPYYGQISDPSLTSSHLLMGGFPPSPQNNQADHRPNFPNFWLLYWVWSLWLEFSIGVPLSIWHLIAPIVYLFW